MQLKQISLSAIVGGSFYHQLFVIVGMASMESIRIFVCVSRFLTAHQQN